MPYDMYDDWRDRQATSIAERNDQIRKQADAQATKIAQMHYGVGEYAGQTLGDRELAGRDRVAQMQFGVGDYAGQTLGDRRIAAEKGIAQIQFGGAEDLRRAQAAGLNQAAAFAADKHPFELGDMRSRYEMSQKLLPGEVENKLKLQRQMGELYEDSNLVRESVLGVKPSAAPQSAVATPRRYADWYKPGQFIETSKTAMPPWSSMPDTLAGIKVANPLARGLAYMNEIPYRLYDYIKPWN